MPKIALGTTRAGLTLKKDIIAHLQKKGFEVDDLGMQEGGDFVPYQKAAANVAREVSKGTYDKAIIICGTGAGSVIVANKFPGIRAVHVFDHFTARNAKAVNDANIIIFGEWITPAKHACELVDTWLDTQFGQGFDPQWIQDVFVGAMNDIKAMEKEICGK